MIVDHVFCGNCEKKMYGSIGIEHCPFCKEYGALQFVNDDEPDIEVQHLPEKVMAVTFFDFGDCAYDVVGNSEEENVVIADEKFGLGDLKFYSTEEFYYQEVKE